MAANPSVLIAAPHHLVTRSPVSSSYTCPRCRELNRRFACRRCGWTPDIIVGGLEQDDEREDAILAC